MPDRPVVALRPFTADDGPFFTCLATDERVTRFIGDGAPWDHETISARVDTALATTPVTQTGAARWFIAHDGDQPVGVLVATRREEGVEIGYWVSPDHWGRGIAGSMVTQAQTVIPEVFDCGVLLAQVDPNNAASSRVLTRRGFILTAEHGGHEHYTWTRPAS